VLFKRQIRAKFVKAPKNAVSEISLAFDEKVFDKKPKNYSTHGFPYALAL
jgi:hypothetical protein